MFGGVTETFSSSGGSTRRSEVKDVVFHPESSGSDSVQLDDGDEARGSAWSIGSQHHALGDCRPCLYMPSKIGCRSGKQCQFCHFPHPKKNRPRPCKMKRMQCKHLLSMLDDIVDTDPRQYLERSEALAGESGYMRAILKGKQQKFQTASESAAASRNTRSPEGVQNASKSTDVGPRPAAADNGAACASPVCVEPTLDEEGAKHWSL